MKSVVQLAHRRPMRTLVALGIAVMLGAVAACGHEESVATPRSEASRPTQTPSPAANVELLEPGAEPREALRFVVAEGAQFYATMTTAMRIGLEIDGQSMPATDVPPMLNDMTATVNKVDPNGDIGYAFTLENFRVADGITMPAELQAAFDQLAGITGQAVMSAGGEHKDFDIDIPPSVDPQMRSSLEGMPSQLAKVSVPFPAEPVGIGASWRTRESAELNGIRTDVTTTYTLRERNGDRFRTDVSYEQSAPEQDAALPGLPPGARARVDGMMISGTGETDGSLSMIFPPTSTMHGSGTIDMHVDDGQSSGAMRQTLDITLGIQSGP